MVKHLLVREFKAWQATQIAVHDIVKQKAVAEAGVLRPTVMGALHTGSEPGLDTGEAALALSIQLYRRTVVEGIIEVLFMLQATCVECSQMSTSGISLSGLRLRGLTRFLTCGQAPIQVSSK